VLRWLRRELGFGKCIEHKHGMAQYSVGNWEIWAPMTRARQGYLDCSLSWVGIRLEYRLSFVGDPRDRHHFFVEALLSTQHRFLPSKEA